MKSYIFLVLKLMLVIVVFSIEQTIGWFFLTMFVSFWLLFHSQSDVEYWLLHTLIMLLFLSIFSIGVFFISSTLFLIVFVTKIRMTNFFSQNLIVGSVILSIALVFIQNISVYPTTIVYALFSLLIAFYLSSRSFRVKNNNSDEFETRFL